VERAVEVFAALYLFGIGLSHVAQPLAWVEFFTWLRGKGRSGVFVEGLLSLGFGSLVVAFHNVWAGWPVVLTLVGWGQVLKGLARLAAPQVSLRAYELVAPERAWHFQVGGAFAILLSAFLGYLALAR
jgi:hypothetical protein